MRKAMSECVVGDDVFGDDPSVIELEKSGETSNLRNQPPKSKSQTLHHEP